MIKAGRKKTKRENKAFFFVFVTKQRNTLSERSFDHNN